MSAILDANLLEPSFEPSDEQLSQIMQAACEAAVQKSASANKALFDRLELETYNALHAAQQRNNSRCETFEKPSHTTSH